MKVLIIDDEIETCRVIETFLKQKGHLITCAYDGDIGLDEIKTNEFDRIVLDLSMPKTSGTHIIAELEKMNLVEKSNIVIYSAMPFSDEDKGFFLKKGVRAFLSKSKGLPELEKTLISC